MSKLNEKTELTKSVIHLMVTSLCLRNCEHCCNKQYSLDDVPYVTDEELNDCKRLFLTGGEPFAFVDPNAIAKYYKLKYKNIEKVYVYTNALELYNKLKETNSQLPWIDGLDISIKHEADFVAFKAMSIEFPAILEKENRIYDFTGKAAGYKNVIERHWQADFEAATDSIFRKV